MIDLRNTLSPWHQATGWCVALSGGLDSTVLLHLLAQQPAAPLRALHVQDRKSVV